MQAAKFGQFTPVDRAVSWLREEVPSAVIPVQTGIHLFTKSEFQSLDGTQRWHLLRSRVGWGRDVCPEYR